MSATQRTQRERARKRLEEQRRIAELRQRSQGRDALLAKLPKVDRDRDRDHNPDSGRKRKFLLGLLMLPLCLLALLTFLDLLFTETVKGEFWKSEGFWFFGSGCVCWLCMGWLRREPGLMYVFAHEMTHAIAVRLSGGRVHDMHVGPDGGFVDTDKTNTLITLSPYLVPFYTGVVFAIFGLLSLLMDMDREWILPWFGEGLRLKGVWVFYFMVGLTWCFHLTFTMQVLQTEQSDLLHNGEFFSMMLIIFINIVILVVLFIAASPKVGWSDVYEDLRGLFGWMWRMVF
ncbi:M50 family metallopeptidase [Phragmitibacter flavus]|nr:M50 family metallopeptidase [Phragmitibacter flavus]